MKGMFGRAPTPLKTVVSGGAAPLMELGAF
jgi:hypothetical protein